MGSKVLKASETRPSARSTAKASLYLSPAIGALGPALGAPQGTHEAGLAGPRSHKNNSIFTHQSLHALYKGHLFALSTSVTPSLLCSFSFTSTLSIRHKTAAGSAFVSQIPKASLGVTFHRLFSSSGVKQRSRMPPKKKDAEEKKIPLGRPGNNLKSGIVGL